MEKTKKKLSIRNRLIIVFVFCLVIFSILIAIFSFEFLLRSFSKLERDQVINNINRTENSLENIINNQSTKLKDWAYWDDTYKFINDKNQKYIDSNLTNESLSSLEINTIIFVNSKDRVVYSKFIDIESGENLPQDNLLSYINSNINEIKNISGKDSINNIIKLQEGDMLISVNQILKSDQSGEPQGIMIFGSFITDKVVKKISRIVNLPVDLYKYDLPSGLSDIVLAKSNLTKNNNNFLYVSKDLVYGYSLIFDIYDKPIDIIRVQLPRDIYKQGEKTMYILILVIIFFIVVLGIILLTFLEKFIIKRLINISNEVEKISDSHDFSLIIKDGIPDEIGELSSTMNKMFKKVKDFEENEDRIEEAEKIMTEKMKKHMDELDKLNRLMVGRELKMIELKKENSKLKEEK